jgi:hypothetical protein
LLSKPRTTLKKLGLGSKGELPATNTCTAVTVTSADGVNAAPAARVPPPIVPNGHPVFDPIPLFEQIGMYPPMLLVSRFEKMIYARAGKQKTHSRASRANGGVSQCLNTVPFGIDLPHFSGSR